MQRKWGWILAVFILPGQLAAQSINARFSTALYSWEHNLSDTVSQNHLRIYQTAQLTVGQIASNRISFHLYTQLSHDIAESAEEDPIPRLYNAYVQWQDQKSNLQRVKIGRQRLYSGVAYGAIDGADVTLKIGKRFKVGGFAGLLAPAVNEITLAGWDNSHAFGLRAGASDLFGTKILLSFMQRNRRQQDYAEPGRFTEKEITFQSLEQRLGGIDLYRSFGMVSAYTRLDYDFLQERVRRGQVELKVSPTSRLTLRGNFMHRAPLIEANSIFSVFAQNTIQDFRLSGAYQFKPGLFVDGHIGLVKYDGDESLSFGAALRTRSGSFGYNFQQGYGGQSNGLHIAFNYPVNDKLALLANTGWSRYSLFSEDADSYNSLTGSFGVNYRPGRHFSVDVLGQGIRNRFLDNDIRVFAKANYWFFGKHN